MLIFISYFLLNVFFWSLQFGISCPRDRRQENNKHVDLLWSEDHLNMSGLFNSKREIINGAFAHNFDYEMLWWSSCLRFFDNDNYVFVLLMIMQLVLGSLIGLEERLKRLKHRMKVYCDASRHDHQEALRALWSATYPDQELHGLISDQWNEMGWQGRDPSTDFRKKMRICPEYSYPTENGGCRCQVEWQCFQGTSKIFVLVWFETDLSETTLGLFEWCG
ncbi:hypothetical protein Dsin_010665 [Dipteronia sinensis]|uniref:ELMO domain-containing protein n=1 Tax=Dipteronia sinensis TaxID=43782 RepID=A0AAE0ATP5_9ROSI|nr:hypothetical protein Dsin_010665 [Dipteronia sinensis]